MRNRWPLAMRIYIVTTFALLLAYGVGRAFTPFWIDLAFIAWCLLFVIIWSSFAKRKPDVDPDRE